MKRVEIDINMNTIGRGSVLVDGHDISGAVRGVTFESQVGELTRVTLNMPAVHETRLVGEALVSIRDRQAKALHVLGWAAPDGTAPAYVHALLDAYLTGRDLDFAGATVPTDVQERLAVVRQVVKQCQKMANCGYRCAEPLGHEGDCRHCAANDAVEPARG